MSLRWGLLALAAAAVNYDAAWRASQGFAVNMFPPWFSVLVGSLCVMAAACDWHALRRERRERREDSDRREQRECDDSERREQRAREAEK